jgi:hypothetical protein
MQTPFLRVAFLGLFIAATSDLVSPSSAMGHDPFFGGYGFGSPLGGAGSYAYSYRNRLPTPPYFSIYSPVYYGRRYERPYGISPFASLDQPGTHPSYYARPKQAPIQWIPSQAMMQPESIQPASLSSSSPTLAQNASEEFFSPPGKMKTVENPFRKKLASAVSE